MIVSRIVEIGVAAFRIFYEVNKRDGRETQKNKAETTTNAQNL